MITSIEMKEAEIRSGSIQEDEAMDLLLEMFPTRLPRMSILMRTFLKLHFADSASGEERYYPRFVQHFLDALSAPAAPTTTDTRFSGPQMFEGRVSPELVYFAHDEASKKFLAQVRQELSFVLELDTTDQSKNEDRIEKLLGAFVGQQTPFAVNTMCSQVAARLNYGTDVVRDAMERMKTLGVFEERPGYEAREWRAGRLFKAALRMKLRR
ncbi:MAG: hypothetical protein NTV51_15810 [Verrucomicrobia bacterium]|nr:hypothetical protein [Verrucomicrobiota bacterium]